MSPPGKRRVDTDLGLVTFVCELDIFNNTESNLEIIIYLEDIDDDMDREEKALVDRFCEMYHELYSYILDDYHRRTRKKLKEYKTYEPEYLVRFLENHKDERDIVFQVSSMCSGLILIQALPNANHRTAFLFIRIYLKKHGLYLRTYDEERTKYDIFYKRSKEILESEINHAELFNKQYFDVQHMAGVKAHRESMEMLFRDTIKMPQSGIVAAESLHSFIASMNHAGSLPFSNQ